MDKQIMNWEIVGIVVISLLGSLFHSLFDWTGKLLPLAIFLPVNESVWEHLKLTYTPALIYFVIEYKYLKDELKNFLIAKALFFTVAPFTIMGGFYLHKLLTEGSNLLFDILLYFAAIAVGQVVSYKILNTEELSKNWNILGLVVIICWGVLYALFTFWVPYLPPFYDTSKGLYGIPP